MIASKLWPIAGAVFVVYLVIGVALPVLPLHVHDRLGQGEVVVGLVSGCQFTAALLSRFWAGRFADRRGGKPAVIAGLSVAAASGLLYLASLAVIDNAGASLGFLLAGRAVLGGAESFIITGSLAWGIGLVGPTRTGVVMAWVGTAMYIAFAVSAPAGSALYDALGFSAIAVGTIAVPLLALALVLTREGSPPMQRAPSSIAAVVGSVWKPGVGLGLSAVGFGAITTFLVLLFKERGWGQAWLAFTLLSVSFALARVTLGHLPDRIGGAWCALVSIFVETIGQALIWLAPYPALALAGAALTGLGYSLVYPGFGVVAVKSAPPESRGLAMGAYTAFLDLALGVAGPALGLVASNVSLDAVFLVSTLVVLSSAAFAGSLVYRPPA